MFTTQPIAYKGIQSELDTEYLKLRSTIQTDTVEKTEDEKSAASDSELDRVALSRVARVKETDAELAKIVRNNITLAEFGLIESTLQKYGYEIVNSLDCVAFMNAPQTYGDHLGESKLYLTRKKAPSSEDYMFTLFFYGYGEEADYSAFEQLRFFQLCCKSNITVSDKANRAAKGVLLSLPVSSLLSTAYVLDDTHGLLKDKRRVTAGCEDCGLDCNALCAPCVACMKCGDQRQEWKYGGNNGGILSSLRKLLTTHIETSTQEDWVNPLDPLQTNKRTETKSVLDSLRTHSIGITYSDGVKVMKGAIVLAPEQQTFDAIDTVCMLTDLIQKNSAGARMDFSGFKTDLKDPLRFASASTSAAVAAFGGCFKGIF